MSKFRILAFVSMFILTSMINKAEAQTQRFDIPLLSNTQKEQIKKLEGEKLPHLKPRVLAQPTPLEIPAPPVPQVKTEIGYKGDFIKIYKAAGQKYGIDWQVLAAIHKVETGQSGDTSKQSNRGATGPMQFIPSTFRAYAIDGDGDGQARINSVYDSIFTAANYLAVNKAQGGSIDFALFRYNHSSKYVNHVKFLASQM